jgi:hypothetical protein
VFLNDPESSSAAWWYGLMMTLFDITAVVFVGLETLDGPVWYVCTGHHLRGPA